MRVENNYENPIESENFGSSEDIVEDNYEGENYERKRTFCKAL